jgi:hypothetical protein
MKNLNGPEFGVIGPQISPGILSRNLSGSTLILRGYGITISFSMGHAVHTKLEDLGNFALKL